MSRYRTPQAVTGQETAPEQHRNHRDKTTEQHAPDKQTRGDGSPPASTLPTTISTPIMKSDGRFFLLLSCVTPTD